MRVLAATSGGEDSHHHHHHHQVEKTEKVEAKSSAIQTAPASSSNLRSRAQSSNETARPVTDNIEKTKKEASHSLKLSAYLNLFGDFSMSINDLHSQRKSILIHLVLPSASS
jgi:zinc transporter 7